MGFLTTNFQSKGSHQATFVYVMCRFDSKFLAASLSRFRCRQQAEADELLLTRDPRCQAIIFCLVHVET
jgi:hypothetical protein